MKVKIRSLDPTGVEVEAEEFELPVVLDETPENGYEEVEQPDGTFLVYEPMRQHRYFLDIGNYIYRINARTGEITLIGNKKD